jgi:hypothetical protein
VVRQGEIEILHPGHGEQIDSNTWAGRPRSVMNTGPWLAVRLAPAASWLKARLVMVKAMAVASFAINLATLLLQGISF